nr:hypothetical protein GTC16762_33290 [Pigmentibacter ruber]
MTKLLSAKKASHEKIALSLINSEIDDMNSYSLADMQNNIFSRIEYLKTNYKKESLELGSFDNSYKIQLNLNNSEDLEKLKKSIKKLHKIKLKFIRDVFKEFSYKFKTNRTLIKAIEICQSENYYKFVSFMNKFNIEDRLIDNFYNRVSQSEI